MLFEVDDEELDIASCKNVLTLSHVCWYVLVVINVLRNQILPHLDFFVGLFVDVLSSWFLVLKS